MAAGTAGMDRNEWWRFVTSLSPCVYEYAFISDYFSGVGGAVVLVRLCLYLHLRLITFEW